jgi:hypothetical protein
MKKKLAFVLVAMLVGTGLLVLVGNAVAGVGTYTTEAPDEEWNNRVSSNVSSSSNTIYVPDDHAKVQWAVNNASAGDTIIIRDGTYVETLTPHHVGNMFNPSLSSRSLTFFGTSVIMLRSLRST